ncbi:hypothetical protein DM01DRAFT_1335424 [Hesseltinella vesiculosa]|uniref:Zn(2)-C6 fungal-type domain-containing protein n=1 Tax=Hesseltinella vesiculosa TaxID=101127 RepID=A0A1X2GJD9_9FUNG|nr:hypothetical protein DM01DRAFT_1335424 [Hesseltinella vesiculosa]
MQTSEAYPSDEFTATGEKRRRLAQACLTCRRKKTKCDGSKPVCGNCQRLSQECNYADSKRRRKAARQGHIDVLEARLAKMETMLREQSGKPGNDNTRRNITVDLNKLSMMPNSDPTLPNMNLVECLNQTPGSPQYVVEMDRRLLPPRDVQETLVNRYLDRLYGCTPFFHPDEIQNPDSCPTVVLMAITTATIKYIQDEDNDDVPPWIAGEKYAMAIRQRLVDILDVPSITHIQVLMLLIMHEFGCARGARSWMLCGMACRMAQEIGLHRKPKMAAGEVVSMDVWRKNELSHRVFWSIYMFDRFGGASTARPVMLNDADIEIHLPVDSDELENDEFVTESLDGTVVATYRVTERDANNNPLFIKLISYAKQDPIHRPRCNLGWIAHMLRITGLFSKVATFVNRSMERENTPLAPFDMESPEYTDLSEALDRWANQLPLNMRNTPANLERYRSENSNNMHRFLLSHVLYNSLIVFLNRPALTLTTTIKTMDQLPQSIRDAIQLGLERCLAASDNVTVMLQDINHHIKLVFPFLSYLTYTTATVVVHSIFNGKPDEAKKAAEALKCHCQFLQNMRKYYAMADKLFFMIRDFYAIHKNQFTLRDLVSDTHDGDFPSPTTARDSLTTAKTDRPLSTSNNSTSSLSPPMPDQVSPLSSVQSTTSASGNTPKMMDKSLDELLGSIDSTFTQLLDQPWLASNGSANVTNLNMLANSATAPALVSHSTVYPNALGANEPTSLPTWPFPAGSDFDLL